MSEENNYSIYDPSEDGEWVCLQEDDRYYLAESTIEGYSLVLTPGGKQITTIYEPIADALISGMIHSEYDEKPKEAVLTWHIRLIDDFVTVSKEVMAGRILSLYEDNGDWSFNSSQEDYRWRFVFGEENDRISKIKEWLNKCSAMQLAAIYFMTENYGSINLSFEVARMMENFEEDYFVYKVNKLIKFIDKRNTSFDKESFFKSVYSFTLYYGIHLVEDGNLINETILELPEEYIGKEVSIEMLTGRGYKHYSNYELDYDLSYIIELPDLTLDECDEDEDYEVEADEETDRLENHISSDCWIKRMNAHIDGEEVYYYVELVLDEGKIKKVYAITEQVETARFGGFMFSNMDMPKESFFGELEAVPEICEEEIEKLVDGYYIINGESFIGKRLPQVMIDRGGNGGSNTNYTYACQSAYRQAYMHMSIDTTEEGIIEAFEYTTYKSTGSEYGDMFSRPYPISDREEEALDMMLYIKDLYRE